MEFWLVVSIILWNIIGAMLLLPIILRGNYWDEYIEMDTLNPIYIYEHTNCNIFGTICLTILVNLLCPIVSICYWFYKLCTVGRKDD